MSLTLSPEMDRRIEAFGLTTTFLAAIVTVLVFFPAEGRVLVPVHAALTALLGQTTFMLPLILALAGGLALTRRLRPDLRLPRRRLAGVGAIALALLPAEHLLGQPTGLVGAWFTGLLVDALGAPIVVTVTLTLVTLGCILAFNLEASRFRFAAR